MVSTLDKMVIEVANVAVALLASVTLTVKLDIPAVVGVPDTTPVDAFSVRRPAASPR